jgi:glutamine---fructose-6-phosphate transaminase (isomerizing)
MFMIIIVLIMIIYDTISKNILSWSCNMSMWNDILSNPANLKTVIQSHLNSDRFALTKAVRMIHRAGHVTFTGVGSGLNATIPASYYLMTHGFPSQYLDATEAAYQLFPGLKESAIVLNTRSGETAELIRLNDLARHNHIPTIAVTNEPGSSVGQSAGVCIPTYSRWDELVVVSAFLGMVATELFLAGMAAGEFEQMAADLQKTAELLPGFLEQVLSQRLEILEALHDSRSLYLLGRGPSLASAISGALVIQETSRRDALALPTGMFRQGPIEAIGPHFRTMMFEGGGETARLNHRLAEELLQQGSKVVWVGSTHLPQAVNILVPELPEHILPLLEIIPTQVLAYDLAIHDGIVPGEVQHIQRVITSEHGIMSQ